MTTDTPQATDPHFMAYDYQTVHVPAAKESLYRDTFAAFGWRVDTVPSGTSRTLSLKRPHALKNGALVNELQHDAEASLRRIEALERSRRTLGSVLAYAVGIVGAAFLAVSVFAMQTTSGTFPYLFGAVGILLWIAAPALYQGVRAWQTRRIRPLVQREYALIYDAGAKASLLRK